MVEAMCMLVALTAVLLISVFPASAEDAQLGIKVWTNGSVPVYGKEVADKQLDNETTYLILEPWTSLEDPKYEWTLNERALHTIDERINISSNGTVNIKRPNKADAGVYVVRLEDSELEQQFQYESAPYVDQRGQAVSVNEKQGKTAQLLCKVIGYAISKQQADVVWAKGGEPLNVTSEEDFKDEQDKSKDDDDSEKRQPKKSAESSDVDAKKDADAQRAADKVSVEKRAYTTTLYKHGILTSTLHVTDLQYSDSDNYTCTASNGIGEHTAWIFLGVKAATSTSASEAPSSTESSTSTAAMTCDWGWRNHEHYYMEAGPQITVGHCQTVCNRVKKCRAITWMRNNHECYYYDHSNGPVMAQRSTWLSCHK